VQQMGGSAAAAREFGGALSTVGGALAELGAAAGLGGIAGLFSKKKKKEYQSIMSALPEEIRGIMGSDAPEDLARIREALQALKAGGVDEGTRQMIDETTEWIGLVEQGREQVREAVAEVAGSLGGELRNALVGAFKAGESAAEAMGRAVEGVLEDMLAQMMFNAAFSEIFKNFQEELGDAMLTGSESDIVDTMNRFLDAAGPAADRFAEAMEAAKRLGDEKGMNLFKPKGGDANTLSGAYARASQESIDLLAGQTGAMRAHLGELVRIAQRRQAEAASMGAGHIAALNAIELNTRRAALAAEAALPQLERIGDNTRDATALQLRAAGKFGY